MGPPGGRKTGTRWKPRSACLFVVLVVTLLLFAMAPAAAQQPYEPEIEVNASVTPHGTPVEPIRDHGQATINVTITCEPLAEREGTESITLVMTGSPEPSHGLGLDAKTLLLRIDTSDEKDTESLPGPIAPFFVVVLLALLKSTSGRSR